MSDREFALVQPVPSEWQAECPCCGAALDVEMGENDDGSWSARFDHYPGNAFTECECGQLIEIDSMATHPMPRHEPATKEKAHP